MSRKSGAPGKTPFQAARSMAAAERLVEYVQRSPEEQLALLAQRPGNSRRETRRLVKLVGEI